jgi:hypothetical protein
MVGIVKIYALKPGVRMALVTDNPYFYIALTSMIIGLSYLWPDSLLILFQEIHKTETIIRLQRKPMRIESIKTTKPFERKVSEMIPFFIKVRKFL